MSRFLITTADERSWRFDHPVLFLGEWCRRYDRRAVWEKLDFMVAEPYGIGPGERGKVVQEAQTIAGALLGQVTDVLNRFHSTAHDARYWNIVLGHWLQRYVAVTYHRYHALEKALRTYDVSGTAVFDAPTYALTTSDSATFVPACDDDEWNHVLFARILAYRGDVAVTREHAHLHHTTGFRLDAAPSRSGWTLKHFIRDCASYIAQKASRHNDAFILNSYLPRSKELKLHLDLGQVPQLWKSRRCSETHADPTARAAIALDVEGFTGYEGFVRRQFAELLPTCYLEGYSALLSAAGALPWPTRPRFIFTSNSFDTDEVFKAWTGSKVEQGVPYFVGQHGNNYATHVYAGNRHWPERAASDKFITWGWSHEPKTDFPAFVFTIAGLRTGGDPAGGLLLIEDAPPLMLLPYDCCHPFLGYQEDQFRFVEALPPKIHRRLTVRLHAESRRLAWREDQRWADRSPNTRLDNGAAPIKHLKASSRLVVHAYDSTGILESLALNIPTVCFWPNGLEHVVSDARPHYETLRKCGILADSPDAAAGHIGAIWDDVDVWWESAAVQEARRSFCNHYARRATEPVRALSNVLTNIERIMAAASPRADDQCEVPPCTR